MLSIFTIPKAFAGHVELIQTNAVESWRRLRGENEIILFSDDPRCTQLAAQDALRHVSEVAQNEHGTPLISDVFACAQRIARHDILCFVNTDIILLDDFPAAVATVAAARERFLMVGRRTNLEITERLDFASNWQAALRSRAKAEGDLQSWHSSDYFIFRRNVFAEIPPFAIGRTSWDNWLMYKARQSGTALIDATTAVCAVHQNHHYGHLVGGEVEAWKGDEARRNFELAGGRRKIYTVYDADFTLKGGRLVSTFWLRYWPRHGRAIWDRAKWAWLADHPRVHRFLRRLRGKT